MCWSGGEFPRHILGETQLAKLFTRLRQGWFYIIELLALRYHTYSKYHTIVIFCVRPHRITL